MKKFIAALIVFAIVLASVTVKAASAVASASAAAAAPASAMASADASAKPAKKHKKAKKASLVSELSGVVAVVKEGTEIKSITVTPAGDDAVAIVLNDAGKALAAKVGQEVTVKGKANAATGMFEVLPQTDNPGAMASGEASMK